VLAGIELINMIRKGKFAIAGDEAMSFANQFLRLHEWLVQFRRCSAIPEISPFGQQHDRTKFFVSASSATLSELTHSAIGRIDRVNSSAVILT